MIRRYLFHLVIKFAWFIMPNSTTIKMWKWPKGLGNIQEDKCPYHGKN
jgi:hypothetical protein